MKAQGMFHTADQPDAEYSAVLELDISTVLPSLAGPKRPQDRVLLSQARDNYRENSKEFKGGREAEGSVPVEYKDASFEFEGRCGCYCGHHFVHQHVQSRGDARAPGCWPGTQLPKDSA